MFTDWRHDLFSSDVLNIDAAAEAARIEASIREQVMAVLRRRGAVVGLSGGIDSSVVGDALRSRPGPGARRRAAHARARLLGRLLRLGRMLAEHLGIRHVVEDIAPALSGLGCYERQAEAIRQVFPQYGEGWRCKITLPSLLEGERLNISSLTVADPQGQQQSGEDAARRLPPARRGHQLQAARA